MLDSAVRLLQGRRVGGWAELDRRPAVRRGTVGEKLGRGLGEPGRAGRAREWAQAARSLVKLLFFFRGVDDGSLHEDMAEGDGDGLCSRMFCLVCVHPCWRAAAAAAAACSRWKDGMVDAEFKTPPAQPL